ncbi:hypothetical protein MAFF211479_48640 (plasmid) [Ralstonia solanacearum]|nr:hypothetical protein 17 [Ralstonia solanacearum]BCI56328.1 hypothetical protein 17 [Ralstonia solanacearum]BCI56363.1 hypothetical protein 14 [Ralstonia solanacearum]BCL95162.1 hypothetical protein MAFF211479_48640 [Ralstonia solanacearum]BCM00266.1 hypothetical protein MAFF211491_47190 [Ralstonia solanacearum]
MLAPARRGIGSGNTGLQDIAVLECWKRYRLERMEWPQSESGTLSLYLKSVGKLMHYEQCGACCSQVHGPTVRRVRDLRLFEYRVGCMCHAAVSGASLRRTG